MGLKAYPIDPDNRPMQFAYDLASKTKTSFFLTGKAGSGKTTFIRYILENVNKSFVVLAPTGVAAMNAGGSTIHSFFGFPPTVIGPGDIGHMPAYSVKRIKGDFWSNIKPADAIIIDEVSMVRCDVMDGIDRTLRDLLGKTEPFGGLQMIFVGDLYQLEPVVTENDRPILSSLYGDIDFYFFSSWAIDSDRLPKIELTKVYRQKSDSFIDLLDHVRVGDVTREDVEMINRMSCNRFYDDEDEMCMYLTAYRSDADRINQSKMSSLDSMPVTYDAICKGDCSSLLDVVEPRITLKVGAQIVFIKNDDREERRWANGTMGIVISLEKDAVSVVLETGEPMRVEREKWEALDMAYDNKRRRTVSVWKGEMEQFPLKAAWALTIHRSQSMTYSRATIDVGRGAFGAGQVYVALSRVRELGGLSLVKPLSEHSIIVNPSVLEFNRGINNEEQVQLELMVAEATDFLGYNLFDEAADALFKLFLEAAQRGNQYQAETFLARYYALVIDDRGSCASDVSPMNVEGIPAAALFLYSGETEVALRILDGLEGEAPSLNETYIRMRCYEEMSDMERVEELLAELLFECEQDIDRSAPTVHHRKVLWSVLLHPELVSLKTLAAAIHELLDDIEMYDGLYVEIRHCILSCPSFCTYLYSSQNVLVKFTLDGAVSDDQYLEILLRFRDEGSVSGESPYAAYLKLMGRGEQIKVWADYLDSMFKLSVQFRGI